MYFIKDHCCNVYWNVKRFECSLIHPDPNESELSDFVSLRVNGKLEICYNLDCNFMNSDGLGV